MHGDHTLPPFHLKRRFVSSVEPVQEGWGWKTCKTHSEEEVNEELQEHCTAEL